MKSKYSAKEKFQIAMGDDAKARRSRDGSSATKNHEKHFGTRHIPL
jgi:hypothetical protein